jgi:hypothetical protein
MEQIFSFTLVGGMLPVAAYFYPFVDGSFELCNNWLCTSSDVEAKFNYPILKKSPSNSMVESPVSINMTSPRNHFVTTIYLFPKIAIKLVILFFRNN